MIKNLTTGAVSIDGGANIGFYSLLASNLVGDSGSVHSFEPGKTTFSILRENVEPKNNIICNEKALWLKTESVSFVNNDLKDNLYGTIKKTGQKHIGFDKSLEVSAVSLDDYCLANRVIPSIIKLDTEGTELDILKGSVNVIINNHPIIVVEILKESIQHGLYKKFSSFLSPYSYKCYQLVGNYSEKEILDRNDINTKFYNFVFK